jgi:hypothetical protein
MADQDGLTRENDLSRRDFVRGAAATGLVVVGAGYVKPALKLAGTTKLASATSRPTSGGGGGSGDGDEDGDHDGDHEESGSH